ncbi:MAG: agmatine deiminase family protein [Candidatus Bilamarchaeum sp.]
MIFQLIQEEPPSRIRAQAAAEAAALLSNLRTFISTPQVGVGPVTEYNQRHFFFTACSTYDPQILQEQLQIARRILEINPNCRVSVFADAESASQITHLQISSERFSVIPFPSVKDIWAQDVGEVVTRNGSPHFLVSSIGQTSYPPFQNILGPPVPIPILFQGGDVTTTSLNGRSTVIIGPQAIQGTREHYRNVGGYQISDDEIRQVVSRAFGVEQSDVILFSSRPDPMEGSYGFHLDQYFFSPRENTIVMMSPTTTTSNDSKMTEYIDNLRHYRDTLRERGFTIIEIPTDQQHISRMQAYSNSISISGTRTHIIMPSFQNSAVLEHRISTILQRHGFEVDFVGNTTYAHEGNTHCITGSLGKAGGSNLSIIVPKIR